MKLESKLLVSLGKRADHFVLRGELAALGGRSQLTEVIKRLVAAGRLVRLRPGVYVRTVADSAGGWRLPASREALEHEFMGRKVQSRTQGPTVPRDVALLPTKGVKAYVAQLARANRVAYRRSGLDDFAEAVTRLAGDDETLDSTGKLLARLRKRSVINGPQMARLMTNHLKEQQDAVRPVR